MRYLKFTFFILLSLSTFSTVLNAQTPANTVNQQSVKQVNSNNELENFLNLLKAAVNRDDPKELAKFISYPCRWNRASGAVMIDSQNDFISSYKLIMNKSVKDSILSSKSGKLVATTQGYASNGGRIWFNPKKGIFAINTLD